MSKLYKNLEHPLKEQFGHTHWDWDHPIDSAIETAGNVAEAAVSHVFNAGTEAVATVGTGLIADPLRGAIIAATAHAPGGGHDYAHRVFSNEAIHAGIRDGLRNIPRLFAEMIYKNALTIGLIYAGYTTYSGTVGCIQSGAAMAAAITLFLGGNPLWGSAIGAVWGTYCTAQVVVSGVISAFETAALLQLILESFEMVGLREFHDKNNPWCGKAATSQSGSGAKLWLNNSIEGNWPPWPWPGGTQCHGEDCEDVNYPSKCNVPYHPDYVDIVPEVVRNAICRNADKICLIDTTVSNVGSSVDSASECMDKVAEYTAKLISKGVLPRIAGGIAASSGALCARKVLYNIAHGIAEGFADTDCAGNLQITWCEGNVPPDDVIKDYRKCKGTATTVPATCTGTATTTVPMTCTGTADDPSKDCTASARRRLENAMSSGQPPWTQQEAEECPSGCDYMPAHTPECSLTSAGCPAGCDYTPAHTPECTRYPSGTTANPFAGPRVACPAGCDSHENNFAAYGCKANPDSDGCSPEVQGTDAIPISVANIPGGRVGADFRHQYDHAVDPVDQLLHPECVDGWQTSPHYSEGEIPTTENIGCSCKAGSVLQVHSDNTQWRCLAQTTPALTNDQPPELLFTGGRCLQGYNFLGHHKDVDSCNAAAVADDQCEHMFWVQTGDSRRCYCSTFVGDYGVPVPLDGHPCSDTPDTWQVNPQYNVYRIKRH